MQAGARISRRQGRHPHERDRHYAAERPAEDRLPALSDGVLRPLQKRVGQGQSPACVKHCQAACMDYGTMAELAEVMAQKTHCAMFTP